MYFAGIYKQNLAVTFKVTITYMVLTTKHLFI